MGEAMIVRRGGGGKITAIKKIASSSSTTGATGVAGKRVWNNLDLSKTYIFFAYGLSINNDKHYEHSAVIRKGEIIDEYDEYSYDGISFITLTLSGKTLTAKTYYSNCDIAYESHVLLEVTLG